MTRQASEWWRLLAAIVCALAVAAFWIDRRGIIGAQVASCERGNTLRANQRVIAASILILGRDDPRIADLLPRLERVPTTSVHVNC